MTEELLQQIIRAAGFDLNRLTGVSGNYYTENRYEDLIRLCLEIIEERDVK